jgi:hypothetical protein
MTSPSVRALSAVSALGRVGIGLGLIVAPRAALSALGFSDHTEGTVAAARLAGVRDIVLGVATLSALDDPARLRAANLANAGADGGDVLTFALALRAGETTAGTRGLAAAVPATVAGLWAAGQRD